MSKFCFKILSAVLYAVSSIFIMLVNKQILTIYKFPSVIFLAFCQRILSNKCDIRNKKKFIRLIPLPFLHISNILFGIASFGALSMPMFTVLRRFSNLFLLLGEVFLLKIVADVHIYASIGAMICGACIAASSDLAFSATGYAYVMANNVLSTGHGLFLKRLMNSSVDICFDKSDIMCFTSVCIVPILLILIVITDSHTHVLEFPLWHDTGFVMAFLSSSLLGFAMDWFTLWCTEMNSPLTTSVIGVMKNVFITYLGMFYGGDYIFTWVNFIGLNISGLGAVWYMLANYGAFKSNKQIISVNQGDRATLQGVTNT